MDKKLTLSLNQQVIEKAKAYAQKHKTSLSKMIEAYFESLTGGGQPADEATPLVKSLTGVIELPADFDYKSAQARDLLKKHQ